MISTNNNTPVVSVCMITYNHEAYIKQAIEGVMIQKANFPIQLVIGDDCSTDKTRSICEEYQSKYPSIIVLLQNRNNLGMRDNFIRTMRSCKGKYIAYCEGDDYWTDVNKLQLQFDFLESKKEYICVHHDDNIINERSYSYEVYDKKIVDADTVDIINFHFISTLSIFFRNVLTDEHFKLLSNCGCLDLGIEWILSLHGRFYYMNKKMGVYRINEGSITASNHKILKLRFNNIKFYKVYNEYTQGLFESHIREKFYFEIQLIKKYWNPISFLLRAKKTLWLLSFIFLYYPGSIYTRVYFAVKYSVTNYN